MKAVRTILRVLSLTLLASTLICGLWLGGQETVDAGSLQFHQAIAVAAVLSSAVTIFLTGGGRAKAGGQA